jgi:hypothetical protein
MRPPPPHPAPAHFSLRSRGRGRASTLSLPSTLASSLARTRLGPCVLGTALLSLLACGDADSFVDEARGDGGAFGVGVDGYPRDGGLDAGLVRGDAGVSAGPSVRVQFLNAIPNTGALLVCHDPDGAGPMSASVLREDTQQLRADYGTRSNSLLLPALATGALTLQRDPTRGPVPERDAGAPDAGPPPDPCSVELREATIPLPITGAWLSPGAALSDARFRELDLLPGLGGASAVTLLGSGIALNPLEVERRAARARDTFLSMHPGDSAGAEDAAALERKSLDAAFGPRALVQPDRSQASASTFTLSVFHGSPDVSPADSALADRQIGAVRLCVTAASRDSNVLPTPPAAGIPFRVRTRVGDTFEARLPYDFRVFAEGAFDAKNQDCSTTSLLPLARASFASFEPGKAYTLALVGAVSPLALCSANDVSIARASCSRPASELGAKLELLAD